MSGNMTEMSQQFHGNRSLVLACFGTAAYRQLLSLESHLNAAGEKAGQVVDRAMTAVSLDDPGLVADIDAVADALDGAKETMNAMYKFILSAIATDAAAEGGPPGDVVIPLTPDAVALNENDPNSTVTVLNAYNPTGQCVAAKRFIIWWHPYFWYWHWPAYWSFYHRIWYFWFCAWYIRIVIRLKVWFWWVWRPWGWPWFWPWGWCYNWWPWGWWWCWWRGWGWPWG